MARQLGDEVGRDACRARVAVAGGDAVDRAVLAQPRRNLQFRQLHETAVREIGRAHRPDAQAARVIGFAPADRRGDIVDQGTVGAVVEHMAHQPLPCHRTAQHGHDMGGGKQGAGGQADLGRLGLVDVDAAGAVGGCRSLAGRDLPATGPMAGVVLEAVPAAVLGFLAVELGDGRDLAFVAHQGERDRLAHVPAVAAVGHVDRQQAVGGLDAAPRGTAFQAQFVGRAMGEQDDILALGRKRCEQPQAQGRKQGFAQSPGIR